MKRRLTDKESLKTLSHEDIDETLADPMMQGSVNLHGYKSAVILEITNKGSCEHRTISATAWLRGDDFDRLIAILKKAKKAWNKNKGPSDTPRFE